MSKIKVERQDIIEAFESINPGIIYFLNRDSGEVIKVAEDFCPDETVSGIDYFSDPQYIRIPKISDKEGQRIREEYLTRIKNEALYDKLEQTLLKRGSLKRFVDILRIYPAYYKDWTDFKNQEIIKIVMTWISELDFELDLVTFPSLDDMIGEEKEI